MVAVASKPAQGFLAIGCSPIWFSVASSTTGLVMPFSVRSPVMLAVFSPVTSTLVDTKVTFGAASASKKSPVLKWASRSGQPVIRDAVSIDTETVDFEGSSASSMMSPVKPENMPTVLE
ncbi:hypothetical protein A6302_03720 [Methylobrevis pamukkalensis]|uniref:Uncharacterized protein n=1 Tax=Methylobrevis pamukkalensis TaxID=1439726 RepID=A0A1E3GY67_9HYPH|nr:hypothetical protein A6302_03720 [Methylobrevis pamukkalensis]